MKTRNYILSGGMIAVLLMGINGQVFAASSVLLVDDNFLVESTDVIHDFEANTTTFEYQVTVEEGQPPALSHLTFSFDTECVAEEDIIGFSPTEDDDFIEEVEVGSDPPTETDFGLKWGDEDGEFGETEGQTRTYSFTLDGIFGVDMDSTEVKIKAGPGFDGAFITGPSCEELPPPPEEETPVGGELISMDNTALFLAGIQSSAVWLIPTIAAVAGTGLYLVKAKAFTGN